MRTIISVIVWASVLAAIAMLSGCSKTNTNSFKVYFYTKNQQMPALYLMQNGHNLGKVPLLSGDPEQLDTAAQLCVTTRDVSTEIDAVDAQGHIIQVFNYKFHDDGTFKESGGGYLLYDTWQKGNYNILIRLNGQFKI